MPDPDHEENTDPLVADVRNFYKVENRQSPRGVRARYQASAAHSADDPAAHAGAGAVATARDSTSSRRVNIIRFSSVAFA